MNLTQRNDPINYRVLVIPYKRTRWEWSTHYWNFASDSCQCGHCQGKAEGWVEIARGITWTKTAAEREGKSHLPWTVRNFHS